MQVWAEVTQTITITAKYNHNQYMRQPNQPYIYIYIYIYTHMADSPDQRQLTTQKWTHFACELKQAYPINRTNT